MDYRRTDEPPCLEFPLPDLALTPEEWAIWIAEELNRMCRQTFLWRFHMHGAMHPALYGWLGGAGGLFLHANHGRTRDDQEVVRVYPMTMCNQHAYEVAALLFAAEIGLVARNIARRASGSWRIAPTRSRCIAALDMIELQAATFEWRLPLPATNEM